MRFQPTLFADAWLIIPEPIGDARGSFARTFCEREFGARGLETRFVQHNISETTMKATLRGLHFQRAPHAEVKLVSCLAGAMYDVIVDLRPTSPTFKRWAAFELTPANGHRLYIPKGFAHGFQALTPAVATNYLISADYNADASAGVRYDDPAFGVVWPLPVAVLSDKDRHWPDFTDARPAFETETP